MKAAQDLFHAGQLTEAIRIMNGEVSDHPREEARPRAAGSENGRPFDDFRALDDLTAGFFEVVTSTGKYYAIPTESVIAVTFKPPQRPSDLIWRQAQMVVRDGPEGDVFLPAV